MTTLQQELRSFQNRWRRGLLGSGVLSAVFWGGLALLLAGAVDYLAGFSDGSRQVVATALAAIAGAAFLYGLAEIFSFARRTAAREADAALATPRREILSALELSAEPAAKEPLGRWLRERAVEAAAFRLRSLPQGRAWPRRQLRTGITRVLVLAAVAAVCFIVAPEPAGHIARRLLQPGADLPPYSPLRFTLTPTPAQVLYGGDLVVTAQISGGMPGAVRVLTRDPVSGRRDESPAYRETEARYSQKLEKVSAPVEVAFATGKTRSAWLPVEVRTQPKVQEVVLNVEPPTYSRLPRREFAVGTQPLAVLAGSRVTAHVVSNRPLAGGVLQLFAGAAGGAPQPMAAELEGTNRLRFTWVVRQGGRLGLTVRDVLNTASEALEFEQKLLPDERPEVTMREPSGLVLATPETELPLEYAANDDLGLARLSLVRRLGTYRERALVEPVAVGDRRHEVRGKLPLAPLGLVPGQTIELSAEAADTNPSLLGVAVSETARVRIISREDYAEKLRLQTTLEDFTGRYEAIEEALEEARQALAALEKAAASGDAKSAEEARQKAMEAHQKTAKIFGELAKDFPIFDLDKGLSASAADVMTKLFENAQELEELKGKSADQMALAAPGLRDRLGKAEERIAEDVKRGERAAKAGAVMEQARRFQELVQKQRDVVKDLNRVVEAVRRGEMSAAQALPEMEQRQKAVAGELKEWENDTRAALEKFPAEFGKLRAATEDFLEAYEEAKIPPVMQEGAGAAAQADGQTSGARAGEALALMEALLRRKNMLAEMMQGEGPEGEWPSDLAGTMKQLMDSLCRKRGNGEGEGEKEGEEGLQPGKGPGGNSDSGYSMRGKMPRLPVYGPSRLQIRRQGSGAGVTAQNGRGGGQAGAGSLERDRLAETQPRKAAGESVATELVPEAYREAVKRYFLPSETGGSASPKTTP